jgi:uncharacterized membrane protein
MRRSNNNDDDNKQTNRSFRKIPIYAALFCGLIILAIGVYMSAMGITSTGRNKSWTVTINGASVIIIGLLFLCLLIYGIKKKGDL